MTDMIIQRNSAYPALTDPGFDDWLHNWHAEHNHNRPPQSPDPGQPVYVPVLVALDEIDPETQFRLTKKGQAVLGDTQQELSILEAT